MFIPKFFITRVHSYYKSVKIYDSSYGVRFYGRNQLGNPLRIFLREYSYREIISRDYINRVMSIRGGRYEVNFRAAFVRKNAAHMKNRNFEAERDKGDNHSSQIVCGRISI